MLISTVNTNLRISFGPDVALCTQTAWQFPAGFEQISAWSKHSRKVYLEEKTAVVNSDCIIPRAKKFRLTFGRQKARIFHDLASCYEDVVWHSDYAMMAYITKPREKDLICRFVNLTCCRMASSSRIYSHWNSNCYPHYTPIAKARSNSTL